WVTALPSGTRPGLVDGFARALASALDLPYVEALTVLHGAEPQKAMHNSAQQLGNAHAKLAIDGAAVRPGPVLLVDDIVDSRWTLTVAGWLLRTHGSGEVHPFALAVASARDD
ncbi:MAG: ATP-dependent DNA helicase RecG, partial [Chloroflexota bacterium]